jgi:hypothetical protein
MFGDGLNSIDVGPFFRQTSSNSLNSNDVGHLLVLVWNPLTQDHFSKQSFGDGLNFTNKGSISK